MIKRPPHLYQLVQDEEWLRRFCTYKQERAIFHWAKDHGNLSLTRIEIEEGDEKQSFVTLHFDGGKITF